jgi:hypothetical protein
VSEGNREPGTTGPGCGDVWCPSPSRFCPDCYDALESENAKLREHNAQLVFDVDHMANQLEAVTDGK